MVLDSAGSTIALIPAAACHRYIVVFYIRNKLMEEIQNTTPDDTKGDERRCLQ